MAIWSRPASAIRNLLRRRRVEQDLDEELRAWVDLTADERQRDGLSGDDARRAALLELGGFDQVKERVRDVRAGALVEQLIQDLAYGWRTMRRQPVLAAAAVLSLALGIGASTAIFSLVDALLLRPFPVDRPEELRVVNRDAKVSGIVRKTTNQQRYDWYRNLRAGAVAFADALAFADLPQATLAIDGQEVRAAGGGAFVTDNYFALLGVTAHRGRVISAGDDNPSRPAAVVLEHGFWVRHFASDDRVIGREMLLNGMPAAIVGVARPGFHGLTLGRQPDLFLPLHAIGAAQPELARLADSANWQVHVVGRVHAGVSDRAAADQLAALDPPADGPKPWSIRLAPIETGLSDVRERFVRPLFALMLMVAILLASACANVTALLASRGSARAGEMAVRGTLGASRGRLVRQLAAEALLLAGIAGTLGVLIASSSTRLLAAMLPAGTGTIAIDVAFDGRVLLFTTIVAAGAAVAAALAPVLLALRVNPAAALGARWQHSSESHAGGRVSRPFIAAQVALALTLVVASGLLARTLIGLRQVDPGFDADRLLAVTVDPGAREYRPAAINAYYRELLGRLRAVPGVTGVTTVQAPLLERFRTTGTVEVAGFTPASEDERWVQVFESGPGFFQTLGIPILAGRDFADQDMNGQARVAAINETAARRFFGGGPAIGRRLNSDGGFEIVAVVRDARYNNLRDAPSAALFVPYPSTRQRTRMTFYARSAAAPAAMAAALQAQVRGLDPLVPVTMMPATAALESGLGQERLLATISTFFAGAALLLLVIGLYGVMSFAVTARHQEIGVRLALGAARGQVALSALGPPLRAVVVGAVLGIGLTAITARFAGAFVFGLAPHDPATIAGAVAVIAIVAVVSAWLPARRAARIDPAVTLRSE